MCVFCGAAPVVIGATAVAQDKQRKKLESSAFYHTRYPS